MKFMGTAAAPATALVQLGKYLKRESANALLSLIILCLMDSEHSDQTKLGMEKWVLFYTGQPANPETGEISTIPYGRVEPGKAIRWITK